MKSLRSNFTVHQLSRFLFSSLLVSALATGPLKAQDKYVQLFAHRGGAHEQDENTIQAFQYTYDKGIRGYETDVRMTSDGVLVIMHDATLDRTTNSTGIVEELTVDKIKAARTKKGNPVPTLDDMLAFLNARPGLYVEFEMKTNPKSYPQDILEKYCDKLYAAVMKNKPKESTYLFTSFDKRPLQYLKSKYPDADLLFIKGAPLTPELIQEALDLGVKRVGVNLGGTSRTMVKEAQKAGLLVSLWPGHTVEDFLLGVYLGSDYLCSDVPEKVLTFVKGNMPWLKIK